MSRYIYQYPNWTDFRWDKEKILEILARVKLAQGLLLGKMESLGFNLREEAVLNVLSQDVMTSSEIEGEILDKEQVRSSIARRMGWDIGKEIEVERNVEGIVEVMLDATQNYDKPLTKDRLLGWHAALFPTGYSGMHKIKAGQFRDDKNGPMQVVSGYMGKEKVHYQAPDAAVIEQEIDAFIDWFNDSSEIDGILKAGIAHLWFITIHPFDDGNGRIARALTDMLLAKNENTKQRFYSISAQIRKERKEYYNILEKTQKGSPDITSWLEWFLLCLLRAIENARDILSAVFIKATFWQKFSEESFNERQKHVINKILDGFEGNLTSSKWAKLCKSSQDTANRDILDLLEKNILVKAGAGRSTHYILNFKVE
ncbi:MAG: Fic family protein [Candidatus Gastranaerophilales bacterium]|nr:Fic family protein [Candidatus Gastranaerophilales bacterium]